MAPDTRGHARRVDVKTSAFPKRAHERVGDLGLALAAEVWRVVMVR